VLAQLRIGASKQYHSNLSKITIKRLALAACTGKKMVQGYNDMRLVTEYKTRDRMVKKKKSITPVKLVASLPACAFHTGHGEGNLFFSEGE
jgi:hypothetical protein